jgi:hypothetical protein
MTINIIRINNEDQSLSVLAVMSPQSMNSSLTTNLPHIHIDAFADNTFDIETNPSDRCYLFAEFLCTTLSSSRPHRVQTSGGQFLDP